MNEFSTEKLKKYLLQSGDHLKPSSLGHRIRCVKSLFRWSHEEGYILKNPAAKFKEPKLGKRIPKFLSELEIELLREACQTTMENALFEFMYSTGCRIGEVVKLNRNDIDFRTNSVIVQGKGDKEREVYFNTRCYIWLKSIPVRKIFGDLKTKKPSCMMLECQRSLTHTSTERTTSNEF